MDIFQLIIIAIVILTMGGWCCDWVFAGTVNPIYTEDKATESGIPEQPGTKPNRSPKPETPENVELTCTACGHQESYSFSVVATYGKVRCKNCGKIILVDQESS